MFEIVHITERGGDKLTHALTLAKQLQLCVSVPVCDVGVYFSNSRLVVIKSIQQHEALLTNKFKKKRMALSGVPIPSAAAAMPTLQRNRKQRCQSRSAEVSDVASGIASVTSDRLANNNNSNNDDDDDSVAYSSSVKVGDDECRKRKRGDDDDSNSSSSSSSSSSDDDNDDDDSDKDKETEGMDVKVNDDEEEDEDKNDEAATQSNEGDDDSSDDDSSSDSDDDDDSSSDEDEPAKSELDNAKNNNNNNEDDDDDDDDGSSSSTRDKAASVERTSTPPCVRPGSSLSHSSQDTPPHPPHHPPTTRVPVPTARKTPATPTQTPSAPAHTQEKLLQTGVVGVEGGQSHGQPEVSEGVPPHVAEAMLMQSPLATSLLQSFLATSLWFSSPDSNGGDKRKTNNNNKPKQQQQQVSDDVTSETLASGSTKDKKKRQELKNTGQSYVNTKGKLVDAKRVWPQDCSRCPLKCNARISEEERQEIFGEYWGLADYNLQREYLAAHMQREEKLGPSGLLRTVILYFLTSSTQPNTKLQVCRQFFLKTLDVSEKASRIVLEKMVRGELGTEGGHNTPPPTSTRQPQAPTHHEGKGEGRDGKTGVGGDGGEGKSDSESV